MITQHNFNAKHNPRLSVLIPYFKDDPSKLLSALIAQADEGIEILLYDDGTGNPEVNDALRRIARANTASVTLLLAYENQGRSAARNALQAAAGAPWLLFLDADMMPADANFLSRYMQIIMQGGVDVIFGGFSMPESSSPEYALHRAFSASTDCLTAAQRAASGPQYVCSSNLAVRSSVLDAETFDTGFTGWGWEDSEWAARIAPKYRLAHIDNPAVHLGLETTDTLLRRFAMSGTNYNRFISRHPVMAKKLALYKAMRGLAQIPFQGLCQAPLKAIVKSRFFPIHIRIKALKLWRASWYAETCDAARKPEAVLEEALS
ncbi:glycosyltransferase family 2 protein [Robiginitomaculum antarcticum]|uniref:glycosyltransferase family 2 protein n=1 Tax=Robiginitomaculum antarcticum TaxID=437507 RepID=UPI00037DFAB0|nr:glycosyltransferase [Robiginitomaculum antarcticum]